MGSWNACCGISKLPIHFRDPVVDFLIGETYPFSDHGFICYSNDLWAPITIQTHGLYDDYGRIEPRKGWHLDYILKLFQEHVIELEQGENEYHDIPVKRDNISYDLIQEAVHEGRLHVTPPAWSNKHKAIGVDINRMMVHQFVFDEIVSWNIDNFMTKIDLNELIRQGMDLITRLRGTDRLFREMRSLTERYDRANVFVNAFRDSESGDLYLPHKFKSYLSFLVEKVDSPDIEDMVTEISKYIIFRARMSEMQFLWTPQTGSQHDAYEELSKLYRRCDDHAQHKLKENDDDDFED